MYWTVYPSLNSIEEAMGAAIQEEEAVGDEHEAIARDNVLAGLALFLTERYAPAEKSQVRRIIQTYYGQPAVVDAMKG